MPPITDLKWVILEQVKGTQMREKVPAQIILACRYETGRGYGLL